MSYKILIVEDDTDINHLLKKILCAEGYCVEQAFSGTEALFYFEKGAPDLIILDLMLPGITGEELLTILRNEKHCLAPVLVLSAKTALENKVNLLQTGADDYITKPFEPEEVSARVCAALRRSHGAAYIQDQPEVLMYKNLRLYPQLHKVTVLDTEISLTVREYEILYLLMQMPEKVYSRESLFEQVWKEGYYGADHTVNVHVSNLRKKIKEKDPSQDYIQSVYGIGFRLAKI